MTKYATTNKQQTKQRRNRESPIINVRGDDMTIKENAAFFKNKSTCPSDSEQRGKDVGKTTSAHFLVPPTRVVTALRRRDTRRVNKKARSSMQTIECAKTLPKRAVRHIQSEHWEHFCPALKKKKGIVCVGQRHAGLLPKVITS